MAKQEIVDKDIAEIRKLLKGKKLTIGTEKTLKLIRLGKLEKIFLSSNCPPKIIDDLNYYKKIKDFKIVKLNYPNDEVGTMCKKPFPISILSLSK